MTTVGSVLYDAVIVPDGEDCAFQLAGDGFAVHFVAEAYKHAKALGAVGSGVALLEQAEILVVEGDLADELSEDMDTARVVVDDLAAVDVDEVDLVQDIDTAVDTDALLEVGVVIDSETSVDFLAAMLAAVAAHRHYSRPIDAIAA
jgi:catalase